MNTQGSPLVSVVLCFYNEEKFIEEAIASVIAQDYPCWELILVDDGSSDNSTAIAKEYARRYYNRIFYVHHPGHCNEGLSASRNLGISKAKGEFVAFLDADDVWYHNKLSAQLNIFDSNPEATVLLEASEYWRSWSSPNEKDVIVTIGAPEGLYHAPELMLKLYPLGTGSAPCPSGIMVRRAVLERSDFEESFRGIFQMYEDQAFLCKLYLGEKVYVSHACHNRYRQRAASLVSSVYESGKYEMVRKYYLQWFRTFLKHKHVRNKRVWDLLDHAMMPYREPLKYQLTQIYPKAAKALAARWLVKLGVLSYSK
ncbi:MAG TPA: glycosyltransferase family 2 protein [Chryseosolibacter sp.]